ncbi:nuclease-related domain-containing protein [Nocardioides sp. Arc9.136]|uniref:nuclease-related domain-containing protein n=1 Tax=Nocardioides sp. Arc9.136 TaxID=2996826 RepID=UPI0026651D30|nr:nuclease-related domain-containing protein [Nocardioides sp. Arc9.136]WKN47408.1 nuclease-related domain-containing protein [Nocardioides sp. Arc9.136]
MSTQPDEKRMRLRYAGSCRACGTVLEARTEAVYERATKTVRCLTCVAATAHAGREDPLSGTDAARPAADPLDAGTAGASARREHERRRARREERIRTAHPKLGGLILALSDDPQSTTAWGTGAVGEERLGRRLDELSSATLRLLHDRRIPGSPANIDHLAVTPTGVYVIDAKRYVGKRPSLRVEGGILRPRVGKLLVGSRDQTKLVDGALKQVELVRSVVGEDVPVVGVLCFIESDWPLVGGAFATRGVDVLWPRKLYPRLTADGPHASCVGDVHARLARALPPA